MGLCITRWCVWSLLRCRALFLSILQPLVVTCFREQKTGILVRRFVNTVMWNSENSLNVNIDCPLSALRAFWIFLSRCMLLHLTHGKTNETFKGRKHSNLTCNLFLYENSPLCFIHTPDNVLLKIQKDEKVPIWKWFELKSLDTQIRR